MNVITSIAEMAAARERVTGTVGLVPTMGYLHEGHLSLVRRAIADNDHVIVSIFVNPTQFGPKEDLARYPRDLKRDLTLLEASCFSSLAQLGSGSRRVSARSVLVFAPSEGEMYPPGFVDWVEVTGPIAERLEGAHRPGHFRGVTTVVARLFSIIQPHRAYFGQKDAQQLRVIRRMVQEQRLTVEIVPMPTVREPDGLAMSSRNIYLSLEEREAALALPRTLALARRLAMNEGVTDTETVRQAVRESIEKPGSPRPEAVVGRAGQPRLALDYVSVADEQTLEELETIDRPALVLLAARVGATRLIDNTILVTDGVPVPDHLRPLIEADAAALPRAAI